MEILFSIFFVALICGAIAASIVPEKNKTAAFFLGVLLGPFGILIAVLMKA